jgi:hypothetical protein
LSGSDIAKFSDKCLIVSESRKNISMLCRGCGNEMIAFEHCIDCHEVIHWICSICEKESERSIHVHHKTSKEESVKKTILGGSAIIASFLPAMSSIICSS